MTTIQLVSNDLCLDQIMYSVITGDKLLMMDLSLWKSNRPIDHVQVGRMHESQTRRLANNQQLNLFNPMPIVICIYNKTNYIIDGQHRIEVLKLLLKNYDISTINILLCTAVCNTDADLDDMFVRVNSGTPVPSSYYNNKVLILLNEYTTWLRKMFTLNESKADNPQIPNFNVDKVKAEMSSHIPLRNAIIDDVVTLEMLIEVTLAEVSIKRVSIESGAIIVSDKKDGISNRTKNSVTRGGFYLGIDRSWPTQIAIRVTQ